MTKTDPYQSVDSEALALVQELMHGADFAALAFMTSGGAPSLSRIAIATGQSGQPVALISDLAVHTAALRADPNCALLIGETSLKGDPLTHPRLTLHCTAQFLDRNSEAHGRVRDHFLKIRPKSKLYIDFPDFQFVLFEVSDGLLNGGFGKAYKLAPEHLVTK